MEKEFHIGKIVSKVIESKGGINKSEFARYIGVDVQNINRMLENKDWHVLKLIKAGEYLDYDFSYLFKKSEETKTEVILQIKLDENKIEDVLKYIHDEKLIKILKQ
ncbi:MAG: hypothetical protein IKR66_04450 [Bacteroidales bacterium]|nr:hypothetical protein [Bacteroidales bacterium]